MKKLIAVATLAASCFAVPVLPANAAALTDAQRDCLVFPMFKKECWDMGAANVKAATQSVAMTTEAAASEIKLPLWWTCTKAEAGSGHLLDCKK